MSTFLQNLVSNPLSLVCTIISVVVVVAALVFVFLSPKLFLLIFKNLRRNVVRTGLTAVATMVLVLMVTMIWTIIFFLDQITEEKAQDFKLIVSEKWQFPSQMKPTYANYLNPEHPSFLPELKGYIKPGDFMTWGFYGGTTDPTKRTRENIVFFFVMNPNHIKTMMDDLDTLDNELIAKLKRTRNGCLMGRERMEMLNFSLDPNKTAKFKVTSMNYKGIDLDFEVVGMLPEGRYNLSAIMNEQYLIDAMSTYESKYKKKHELDNKRLALIWLRVRDRRAFEYVADIIENGVKQPNNGTSSGNREVRRPIFDNPQVKCETASSGIAAFLDAYRDLIWFMKWGLVPIILLIMSLVAAITISINVRERRTEMAVLKVLGYQPWQILTLVLGEALLVGALAGLLSAVLAVGYVNLVLGGFKFPIAFFPAFLIPNLAVIWGLGMGAGTALLGSLAPAWSACSIKVNEAFSKVG